MILNLHRLLVSILLMVSIVIFSVVCLSFSIVTISKAKIIVQDDHMISIESIKFELGKKLSHIKLKAYKITLQDLKTGENNEIISDAYFSFNLDMIYQRLKKVVWRSADDAIFNFHINGINLNAIIDFKNHRKVTNDIAISQSQDLFFQQLTASFNKYYVRNLKVNLSFKEFDLNKFDAFRKSLEDNIISIQKLSFSTIDSDKKYIGNVGINYQLNNISNNLNVLLIRQSTKVADIQARIYGYVHGDLKLKKYHAIKSNDFIQLFLSYDIDDKVLLFETSCNKISLDTTDLPLLNLDNIAFSGFYNGETSSYNIANINFDVVNNGAKHRFSGSIIKDKLIEISLSAHDLINVQAIFDYWPIKLRLKLYNVLSKLIQYGNVRDANLRMKIFSDKYNLAVHSTKLDLKVVDANLSYENYKLSTSEISLDCDENHVSIKTNKATLDKVIDIANLDVNIPFKKDKTEVRFELGVNGDALRIYTEKKIGKKIGLFGGKISALVEMSIPHKHNLKLQDISLDSKTSLHGIKFDNKVIDAKKLDLHFKNDRIILKGDVNYDEIKVKQLKVDAIYNQNKPLKINSLECKIPLAQDKIQDLLGKAQLKLDGIVDFRISSDNRFTLNLSETSIEPKFGLVKQVGELGKLEFTYDKKILKDVRLLLPNLELQGEVILSDKGIDSAILNFNKFHNSKFNLQYNVNSSMEDEYFMDASHIDLADIRRIFSSDSLGKTAEKHSNNKSSKIILKTESLVDQKQALMSDINLDFLLIGNKLVKIDGFAYGPKNGYVRVFFDETVVALIINNTGYMLKNLLGVKSLSKGNLELYGLINEKDKKLKFSGELYAYNFKLLESYLLSTILKIYAVSGFSVTNIFQMFNNGINFSNMHCSVASDDNTILFDKCQAFSNTMLLSFEAKLQLDGKSGDIEGLIIPKNFFNAPIIFLQKILSKKGKTLLDGMDDKQNFSISWQNGEKPIVKTNPISFLLPSIFSNFFSKNKTVKNN